MDLFLWEQGENMKHLSFDNRKTISNLLTRKLKCFEIALAIGCDPTTISKEIKKNRTISRRPIGYESSMCEKLNRFPHVCLGCDQKYGECRHTQFKYDPSLAQKRYETLLVESRRGINLTIDEHAQLNSELKDGLAENKSVYAIVHESSVDVSVQSVYRYVNSGVFDTKKIDLPHAVRYKKRKTNKKYDYHEQKFDKGDRTYIDFLAYRKAHINEMTVEMDFLGSIRSDSKSILVLIIPELSFPFLFIINKKDSSKVVDVFDYLEDVFGHKQFKDIFPSILTDNDPCFSDFVGIENSKFNENNRTLVFFCDPYRSTQKAHVENMNKQLRKYFPKGKSVDHLTQESVYGINKFIIEQPLQSLSGATPKDAFIRVFGASCFSKYFK